MAISSTPTASEINVELGRAPTAPFSMDGTEERALAGVLAGPISFSDFIGKSAQPSSTHVFTAGADGTRSGWSRTLVPLGSIDDAQTPIGLLERFWTRFSDNRLDIGFNGNKPQEAWLNCQIVGITNPSWNSGGVDVNSTDGTLAFVSPNTYWYFSGEITENFVSGHEYQVDITYPL